MSGSTVSGWGAGMVIDGGGAAFMAAAMLRQWEGLRLAPYLCPAGLPTIGYGHVILPHEQDLRGGISRDEAEALLLRDLAWALFAARDVGRVLTDGQAAALASLIFNIGRAAWAQSAIRRAVVAGDFCGAAAGFARWCKVGGQVVPGLVARRAAERHLFEGDLWIG